MGRLIDDLLALSRLGREPLRTRRVELEGIVREVIKEANSDLDGRSVRFVVGELGSAEADPALLKQAFTNLLSNAVKFTRDRNPAVIEVGRRDDGVEGPTIYYVKDNGAGFDMQYANKLFGVFQRLHRASEYPGTGVGLAIVARVVSRHGGRVWAEARPGEGATFYLTLSGEPSASEAAASGST